MNSAVCSKTAFKLTFDRKALNFIIITVTMGAEQTNKINWGRGVETNGETFDIN